MSEEKPKKPRKRKPKKQVWQRHHITYPDGKRHPPQEWVVRIAKSEHWLLTQLQRFGSLSDGAVQAILYELSMKPRRTEEV